MRSFQRLLAPLALVALFACASAPPPLASYEPCSMAETLTAKGAKQLGWLTAAGQPTVEDLQALADSGARCVINLRTAEEMTQSGFDEASAAEAAGMRYVTLPIASAEAMTDELLDEARVVLKECRHSGVLMH